MFNSEFIISECEEEIENNYNHKKKQKWKIKLR